MSDAVFEKVRFLNNKAAPAARDVACELRFGQVGLVQLRLRSTDPDAIFAELILRITTAPQLFERAAVCLDLSMLEQLPEEPLARELMSAIRRAGMLPVGLAFDGTGPLAALAASLDMPMLTQFRAHGKTAPVVKAAVPPPPAAAQPAPVAAVPTITQESGLPALMQHQPVRSGQRVYGRNRDVVVTTVVGAGAEVMADGCVHVYGSLRGRAMAGARGDTTARVFCQEFHAELVSIAGVFRVFETIPEELVGKPVQAWLDGEDLRFAAIGG